MDPGTAGDVAAAGFNRILYVEPPVSWLSPLSPAC